ncbi:MAG TPA: glutaredoxin family protein [Anaerolineales bacterium]|nr:glutaredoxin family protein [Anaerolineales bacterium]HRQ92664.1 glutaredoxin family protein [Anaerolineales bacterium]
MTAIFLYGAADCDDTERTRQHLHSQNIEFTEVSIDTDAEAERFVIFINRGFRSTPTLVIGEGKRKVILTEPSNEELDAELQAN